MKLRFVNSVLKICMCSTSIPLDLQQLEQMTLVLHHIENTGKAYPLYDKLLLMIPSSVSAD